MRKTDISKKFNYVVGKKLTGSLFLKRNRMSLVGGVAFMLAACSSPLIETAPEVFTDTSTVTVFGNATKGNKGLAGFREPVYVHLGLITDSSLNATDWRYVKFAWGSADEKARAKEAGGDKWSYTIPNVRRFFGVAEKEKVISIAVLFRSGNCLDTFCKVLRNEDKSDIMIPVMQQ